MRMASRNKKTTMAKLQRESRLRERRLDKKARKDARRHEAEFGPSPVAVEDEFDASPETEEPGHPPAGAETDENVSEAPDAPLSGE
jgi:hypothetical protein